MSLGADFLATGHYAKIHYNPTRDCYEMKKAQDPQKDQSYFLYSMRKETLSKVLFPLGDMTKDQVRDLARKYQLNVADKPESQDICFVPDSGYKEFIRNRLGDAVFKPGAFRDHEGKIVGSHPGIMFFTIGERVKEKSGFKIDKAFRKRFPGKLYIAKKDRGNKIIIAPENHPILKTNKVFIKNLRKIKKSDTQKDTKIFEKKNFKADEMKQKLAEGVAEDTPRVSESLEGKSLEKIAKTATKTEDRIAATRLLADSHKLTKQGFDKIQPILRNYGQEVYVLKRQLQLATTDQIADIVKKMSRDDHGKTDVAIFDSPNFIEYYKNLTLEGFIETLKSPAFRVKWTAKFSDPSFDAKQNVKVSAYNSDAQRRGGRPFVPGV